jgi:hypothetical protein
MGIEYTMLPPMQGQSSGGCGTIVDVMESIAKDSMKRRNCNERARSVIYAYSAVVGAIAGIVIVGYREAIERLEGLRRDSLPFFNSSLPRLALWLGIAGALGLITALMVRRSP